ncbi:hypothetical protein ACX43S_25210 [Enterobacter cloacae]
MIKQFLLAGSAAQMPKYREWRTLCCVANSEAGMEADVIIALPSRRMSPLSRGLYALEELVPQAPLVISTQPLSENLLYALPDPCGVVACLSEPDVGYISFHTADDFIRCAKDAIRAHDPRTGEASLMNVWQQAVLQGLAK